MRIPLPKLRELAEAVRAVVAGPYTTRFPKAVDSVHPNFRGLLKFNAERCICCGACTRVCPARAREIVFDRDKQVWRNIHHAERCIYCGQCVLYCTVGDAIVHTTEFDAARTERSGEWVTQVEREAAVCEDCGESFAAKAHLDWIARRVGDLMSANPTLILSRHRELGLVAPLSVVRTGMPYRSSSMRILCPTCRRRAVLREEWGY